MSRRAKLALVSGSALVHPTLATTLASRAYRPHYRPGEVNRCPGCGRSQWHVGRLSAECAFCEAVVPLAPDGAQVRA